jgi:predicted unusual protein kinase regulating ubiquinone biosynthesis (AarF/ABC1/UbiB family)
VPRPLLPLTTREVLVMEFLEGKKLYDAVKEYGEAFAAEQGRTFKNLGEHLFSVPASSTM